MKRLRGDGEFHKTLVMAMASQGVSCADVARKLGVSRSTVYGWTRNVEPSDPSFRALCKLFPELKKFAGPK